MVGTGRDGADLLLDRLWWVDVSALRATDDEDGTSGGRIDGTAPGTAAAMGFLPPRANRVSILLLAILRLRDPPATGGGGSIDATEAAGAIPEVPVEGLLNECGGRTELRS